MKRFLGFLVKQRELLTAVVGAALGILMAHWINPFAWVPIVPEDSAYDICITVYFAITNIFLDRLVDSLVENWLARISIIISTPSASISVESEPIIDLDANGLGNLCVKVDVHGKKEHFVGSKIIIPALGLATIQPTFARKGVLMDDDGNNIIEIDSILGQSEVVKSDWEFRFVVAMTSPEDNQSELICPRIDPKKWNVYFKGNQAIIRMGR